MSTRVESPPNPDNRISTQLFEPDVFSDWDRTKSIIAPIYQRLTSFPLNCDVRFVSEDVLAQIHPFAAGRMYRRGEIEVLHPRSDQFDDVSEYYRILFHELGHHTYSAKRQLPVEENLKQDPELSELFEKNAEDFFRIAGILHAKNGDFLNTAFTFGRIVGESYANAFSVAMLDSILGDDQEKLRNGMGFERRDAIVLSQDYRAGSRMGWMIDQKIVFYALFSKHKGDVKTVIRDLEQLSLSQIAVLTQNMLKKEGALHVINDVNRRFTERYGLDEYSLDFDPVAEEDLQNIAEKGNLTHILQTVASPAFAKKLEQVQAFFFEGDTKTLIKDFLRGDFQRAVGQVRRQEFVEKDRVLFLFADYLASSDPDSSQQLFKDIVEQYPRSPWRYRGQHRIIRR